MSLTQRRLLVLLLAMGFAAAGAILLRFPPTLYSFYPQCPIYEHLHLQCPGCGSTRALAALLHGHLHDALRFNALFVVILPVPALYAALLCRRAWMDPIFRWPAVPPLVTHCALATAALFTVIRNLPG